MIIIPTYNERENITELVFRIRKATGSMDILFVDDSSPDGTADEIRLLQSKDQNIQLLSRSKKEGIGPAYRQAMENIINKNFSDFIITMDADLSHPPEKIPEILELLKINSIVVGSRYVKGGGIENWSFFRRLISRGGSTYARILTGVPIKDMTAGFVGYQVLALKSLDFNKMSSDGYNFQIEMKYLLHRAGKTILETPITFTERGTGESKFSFGIILEAILYPLKIFLKDFFDLSGEH